MIRIEKAEEGRGVAIGVDAPAHARARARKPEIGPEVSERRDALICPPVAGAGARVPKPGA